jgi:surfeit locus 1 family protein
MTKPHDPIEFKSSPAGQSSQSGKFRPTAKYWLAIVFGLAVTALAFSAAAWQHQRAQFKRGLQAASVAAQQAPALDLTRQPLPPLADVRTQAQLQAQTQAQAQNPLNRRRVRASGAWLPEKAVFLDNRIYKGRPGREVLMPLRLDNGAHVLVNRGWIAQPAGQRGELPQIRTQPQARIDGLLMDRLPHYSGWGDRYAQNLPAVWPNFDMQAYRQASGLTDLQWIVLQTSPSGDGLVRDWPAPGSDVDRHLGYQFQWLGLALLAAGLTLYFGISPWRNRK